MIVLVSIALVVAMDLAIYAMWNIFLMELCVHLVTQAHIAKLAFMIKTIVKAVKQGINLKEVHVVQRYLYCVESHESF